MTIQPPDWAELVPEVTLRPQQIDALDQIWRAFYVDQKRVVLLEAPTGVGKSIIQLALCRDTYQRSLGSSYIVTPQRALQDQLRSWDGLQVMKGKGSYECNLVSGSAATAPCNRSGSVREAHPDECSSSRCPYYSALDRAMNSPVVVHNYASLMAQAHIGRHFGPRDLLCMDEGHTAADWVRNYMSSDFTPEDLRALTDEEPPRQLKYFVPWLRWVLSMMDSVPKNVPDNLASTLAKLMAHRSAFGIMSEQDLVTEWEASRTGAATDKSYEAFAKARLMDSGMVPWATQWNDPTKWHPEGWWSTVPLRVAPMAGSLTNLGGRVLIITATVLNKPLMAAELGLKKFDPHLVSIDSAFDPANRPIVKDYAGSMSFKSRKSTMPKMIEKLARIAMRHGNEQGIVHTVSHFLAKDIVNGLRVSLPGRVVEQLPSGAGRDAKIQEFLSGAMGPSAILVGPSMMEGIDGKDDSCRWQAMCKAPWPHMKDPVVDYILNSGKSPVERKWGQSWYSWKAAQQTVQGIGRVCRTPTDFGVTYLLDSGFDRILKSGYIPQYVLDAVK